ncbi:Non-catalytic module family DOC2 [Piromyces sp. E2]|nr:Non-catalytic module family DOC2 [Piromyces sp. E2]|eukprot:OUM68760.1 Non-catalytic module family DOC2 [Piromyces sp. E2]
MKALVLTTKDYDCSSITLNFNSYGIPYDLMTFTASKPFTGTISLYDNKNQPKYNLIVINGGNLVYENASKQWVSALSADQWSVIEDYEAKNSVRRVIISDEVSSRSDIELEVSNKWGVTKDKQPLISDTSADIKKIFQNAGVKINAPLDINGIYHTRVKITNTKTTKPMLYYDDNGKRGAVAATVAKYDNGREVMSFFFELGSWHQSSAIMNHLWLNWGTRSLYNGFRRVYFTPHIDDVFLSTELVDPAKDTYEGSEVSRTTPFDMQKIAQFQKDILKDMPEGSFFRSELAFNGNGAIISGNPEAAVEVDGERYVDIEFVKKPGTGEKRWEKPNYKLSQKQLNAINKDPLFKYFNHNETAQKEFFWSSHTFTHENLDNASRTDVDNEIRLNIEFAELLGLTDKEWWSGSSMVTPQISGLHNKDAIDVFLQYGIKSATGDLSRKAITNAENPYLPFYTTKKSSNYEGFPIIPRTPTEIYYFCSTRDQDLYVYNKMYNFKYTFDKFLEAEGKRTFLLMSQLRHEAHQFHQANLRYYKKQGKYGESLLEDWTRGVLAVYNKYLEWPLISIKIDRQAEVFIERAKLEACGHESKILVENNKIVGVSVSATKGECIVPITVPTTVKKSSLPAGATLEQVGKDPLTVWVPVKKGETKTFKFDKALDWKVNGSNVKATTTTTTTTTIKTTTTTKNVEPTNKFKCFAETLGYQCCPSTITEVYYTDENGDWGYDYQSGNWCGLHTYIPDNNCWSKALGFKCCHGCVVVDEDEDGNKWGFEGISEDENENWCGIDSRICKN